MALNFDPCKYYPPTSSIPPALFSGREAEFAFLKKRVIAEGKRIGLISGENVAFTGPDGNWFSWFHVERRM